MTVVKFSCITFAVLDDSGMNQQTALNVHLPPKSTSYVDSLRVWFKQACGSNLRVLLFSSACWEEAVTCWARSCFFGAQITACLRLILE